MPEEHANGKGRIVILIQSMLWGLNFYAIKLSDVGLSDVFTASMSSLIASFPGIIYCFITKQSVLSLTAVFGVFFWVLLSKGLLTIGLTGGHILISIGIYFTNIQSEMYLNTKNLEAKDEQK
ncbi:MAG TPA: hypothetical protein PK800_05155 [Syntrophorhabdaceae bacterium]|nr:hypothetical protein [Syntrophorhabdaceae bacterium]